MAYLKDSLPINERGLTRFNYKLTDGKRGFMYTTNISTAINKLIHVGLVANGVFIKDLYSVKEGK